MQLSGTLAGQQTGPRRRTNRSRSISCREPHPLSRELLEIRRVEHVSLRAGNVRVHWHRKPAPTLIVGQHQEDVGPIRLLRSDEVKRTHDDGEDHRRRSNEQSVNESGVLTAFIRW